MIPGQGGSFGRFRIVSVLGRGATGVVLHAHDTTLDRPVALKLLHGGDRASHEQIERLRREAEALARLNHPHVVRVYEAGSHEGVHYVALERIEGKPLRDLFDSEATPLDVKLVLLEEVAQGVEAAHRAGVVHRDLKPENVLVNQEGRARVVDFGLARVEDVSIALTKTGVSLGTPFYMAPESARGAASEIGPHTDVFSLGAMLFEALTGESPYSHVTSLGALLHELASNEPAPRASTRRPDVSPALEAVCARALAKDPSRRFASAAEFASALAAARGGTSPPAAKSTGRRLALALVTLVIVALGVAGLALGHARAPTTGPTPDPNESPHSPAIELVWREPAPDAPAPDGRVVRVAGRCTHARELTANGRPVALQSSGEFDGVVPFGPDSEVVLVARGEGVPPLELRRRLRSREGVPAWLRALPEPDRPPLPLPRGVVAGETPGEYANERDGSVLVFVPGGPFEMGARDGEDRERPVHRVVLSPYFVGKVDVSNEQFAAFVAATVYVTDAERAGWGMATGAQGVEARKGASWRDPVGDHTPAPAGHPVVQVSWNDAIAYARWAGLALPTEAQWERAAGWDPTARRMRRFSWGDEVAGAVSRPLGNVADFRLRALFPRAPIFEGYDDGYERTSPVGSYVAGASPSGALDMTGNVTQWCLDSYEIDSYVTLPDHDPVSAQPEAVYRSVRGSHWANGPQASRVTRRLRAAPDDRGDYLGFRVALSLAR